MSLPDSNAAMDQAIFSQGLSTITISVYLLCCGLSDAGTAVTLKTLEPVWQGSKDELMEGLETLQKRNIIILMPTGREGQWIYLVNPASKWRMGT